jgi:deoxyribodipyrimidine photolyase
MRDLDRSPNGHVHVSRLSAALRRRLISEEEVVAAVVARHGPMAAEKFICEVLWRTY